ncbi:MAG: hypothetical protein L0G54_14645 [Brevibacterium sp.]|nr:hypothetical protein [Brevibacterium sp.]
MGPHQTIDHTIDQTIDCVTTDPSESAERENVIQLKDIDQERYSHLLGWIQNAGLAEQSKESGRTSVDVSREEYFNAFDQVSIYIFELFGEDFEDLLQHEWSIPAKAADRYQAGKWLKMFLRTAVKNGRYFYPDGYNHAFDYSLKVS